MFGFTQTLSIFQLSPSSSLECSNSLQFSVRKRVVLKHTPAHQHNHEHKNASTSEITLNNGSLTAKIFEVFNLANLKFEKS
jgi:hypothetical protein